MMNKARPRWDIFCKIVDNFGDIGICWRLAQQLHQEHQIRVRLLVDEMTIAKRIIPSLDPVASLQRIHGVEIQRWNQAGSQVFQLDDSADVVLETFSCGLPELYLKKLDSTTIWINLDYLTAESWVENFHGHCGIYAQHRRYLYYPGFNKSSGGLIRESHLPMPIAPDITMADDGPLKVSMFCYANAPLLSWLTFLSKGNRSIHVMMPFAPWLEEALLEKWLFELGGYDQELSASKQVFAAGSIWRFGKLTLELLPFLTQSDYDLLMRQCDINFVRGEDSWVRAIWAGRPFIWQPYVQEEDVHLIKLDAFLKSYYADMPDLLYQTVENMHIAWSKGCLNESIWLTYTEEWPAIAEYVVQKSSELFAQQDLASKLVIFCNKL